ncbi:MAG: glycerol-3-phosphate 1-O-acyltransferase PlsY [bacterium]|nr:glycerol-3-phosphate 1-O-acyltransferase PlsY [bacterium]
MEIVWTLLVTFGAYIIGSFPTGYLIVKALKGQDIREVGSGSTGATNVKRVLGKKGFYSVLLIDAIKGFVPVMLAKYLEVKLGLYADLHLLPIFASAAVVIGHSKSIFLNFTGGKSVATMAGVGLAIDWRVAVICYFVFAIVAYISKYISLASIIVMVLMVILIIYFKNPPSYITFCSIIAIYVIYLHRENIKRLIQGTENKVR